MLARVGGRGMAHSADLKIAAFEGSSPSACIQHNTLECVVRGLEHRSDAQRVRCAVRWWLDLIRVTDEMRIEAESLRVHSGPLAQAVRATDS